MLCFESRYPRIKVSAQDCLFCDFNVLHNKKSRSLLRIGARILNEHFIANALGDGQISPLKSASVRLPV